jgi:polyisoprenoid-binding protein YceI
MKRLLAFVVACACASGAVAADWTMDGAASRLEFAATFEGMPASGQFRRFETKMRFDPLHPADGRLEVVIAVASADMSSADINQAIAGPEWFDSVRHPEAEFRAAEIREIAPHRYVARGTLTLKGVQRPVDVPFTWSGNDATARMEGELVVSLGAFGIGTGQWAATNVIGSDVSIRFRVQLHRTAG